MPNKYDGTLIAIEGIDGSGKSHVASQIDTWTKWMDQDVMMSKEPTPLMTGDWVYEALSNPATSAVTDFLLFCADRTHHVNVMRDTLADGDVVITDRYADSTRAYQTSRLVDEFEMSETEVAEWMEIMFEPWNIKPDLTIYIDVPAEVGIERCGREDKFENRETLEAARNRYLEMYAGRQHEGSFVWIDGQKPKHEVSNTAIRAIEDYLYATTE